MVSLSEFTEHFPLLIQKKSAILTATIALFQKHGAETFTGRANTKKMSKIE